MLVFGTAFGKTNLLNEKNKIHFIALLPFTSTEDAALLIEANMMFHLLVRHASFPLFLLASSCSNDYFHPYMIIDFLTNRLVFLRMVTFM